MIANRSEVLMRPVRRCVVILSAVLALSGCGPAGETPGTSPQPADPGPSTSASPSETPDTPALVLPETCDSLVPIAWIRSAFGGSFQNIPYDASSGDPTAADFAARGGLACLWGIPNSDAGVTLFVAERATPTDETQVAEWEAAGYQLGPDFLDACWFEQVSSEIGEMVTVHALVEGYELRAQGPGVEIDPYLSLIRQATDSMGYV